MKVLLFEQWSGGHYLNYLHCLLSELRELSSQLVIGVNAKMRVDLERQLGPQSNIDLAYTSPVPEASPSLSFAARLAATRNLLQCINSERPDFVIIPSADAQSTGMAALNVLGLPHIRRMPLIEGTIHYGYGHSALTIANRMKEQVYSQSYGKVPYSSVNFVNFAYYEFARARGLIAPSRMRFVGDPVPQPKRIGQNAARRLLGLDPTGRYIGLFGSLDRRKAIPELLAAFRTAALGLSDRLVLGGRLDARYAKLISSEYTDLVRSGQLVVIDRFLSENELENAYESLDVAAIVYYEFPGLASLALKAIASGTPLIVNDFGWLRALVKRFDVGETTDIHDVALFGKSLKRSLETDPRVQGEATMRLLRFHEPANFVARMTSGLRNAASLPAVLSLDWNWVLDAVPPDKRSSC